jgi:hypothetical protein
MYCDINQDISLLKQIHQCTFSFVNINFLSKHIKLIEHYYMKEVDDYLLKL